MSMLEEYKKLEEERKKLIKSNQDHYNGVDLPGQRKISTDGSEARKRIAEMAKIKERPNH